MKPVEDAGINAAGDQRRGLLVRRSTIDADSPGSRGCVYSANNSSSSRCGILPQKNEGKNPSEQPRRDGVDVETERNIKHEL